MNEIAELRATMRGHKSAVLKATLKSLQREYDNQGVAMAALAAEQPTFDAPDADHDRFWIWYDQQHTLVTEERERLWLILAAIKEELHARWVYWHNTHAPHTGFTVGDRAHIEEN